MHQVALHNLATEQINDQTRDLDRWSPLEIVSRMNQENAEVVRAVEACLPRSPRPSKSAWTGCRVADG